MCATDVQGIEIVQIYPTTPLVEGHGRRRELLGKCRRKVISVLYGMRHLLVGYVPAIARQDAWIVHVNN